MTQGSTMNPIQPAAIVQPSAEAANVLQVWRELHEPNLIDHGAYALARFLYRAEQYEEDEFFAVALKKLVRTFSPVRNIKKLQNGRREFDTLLYVLQALRRRSAYAPLPITDIELDQLTALAGDLYEEARVLGPDGLRAFDIVPPKRVKKPYRGE